MAIIFISNNITYKLSNRRKIKAWINEIVKSNGLSVGEIAYIFCNDKYILDTNKEYLNHNYYTDIITFDYSNKFEISGDIFISIETVSFNTKIYNTTFENELLRVMIHGILHLIGFNDKTASQRKIMHKKENEALKVYNEVYG